MPLPFKEKPRERALSRDELKRLWQAIEEESNPLTVGIFKLTFLTAQRIGSVRAMRWDQLHRDAADTWTIPPESFKGKRSHLVPLSVESLEVLAWVEDHRFSESGWVFPSRGGARTPHVQSTTNALARIVKRVGGEPFVAHDARTTFRTHATRAEKPEYPADPSGCGTAPDVADLVLGHKILSVGQIHYQADQLRFMLAEKREAMARWGEFLKEAVSS
jgi:integrase